MKTGLLPAAAVLLILSSYLQLDAIAAEDLYWEGDEDASNEFLEVKDQEDLTLGSHIMRIKRSFLDNIFGFAPTTQEPPPDLDDTTDDNIDDDDIERTYGSGALPDITEVERKEKTLRVSFVLNEPYQDQYSNRDSSPFQNLSRSLAEAVNLLYDSLPGTQRASLVRIQSRISDEFSCKVTLDVITTGYDDTNSITRILQDHIRARRTLGPFTVSDNDFNAVVIDPGVDLAGPPDCGSEYRRCDSGQCVPIDARCNGIHDCDDGSDEINCKSDVHDIEGDGSCKGGDFHCDNGQCIPMDKYCDRTRDCEDGSDEFRCFTTCAIDELTCLSGMCVSGVARCDGHDDCDDATDELHCPNLDDIYGQDQTQDRLVTTTEYTTVTESETPYTKKDECFKTVSCMNRSVEICANKICDGIRDCPDGDDELGCSMQRPEDCPPDFISCDLTRCYARTQKCDGVRDCDDGSDEEDCSNECTSMEFRCNDGFCLELRRRCDGLADCSSSEDEHNCRCGLYKFECDGRCIDIRKRCDGYKDCNDSTDELNCNESIKKEFTCDSGIKISPKRRCNQIYDCPVGDLSDEKNCPCGEGDFKCDNGYCIPISKHCDQSHDCQDGSDERNCTNDTYCMASQYKCMNGKCINAALRCDGQNDCMDGSDETFCHCETDQFRCPDGSCINIALRCNGLKDCRPGGEDEFNCGCPVTFWKCGDGSCIANSRRCNGFIDCYDGSDEKGCSAPEFTTASTSHERRPPCHVPFFQCYNGTCLDKSQKCDGRYDCEQMEDELDCQEKCPPDHLVCDGICYHLNKQCNGIKDCPNGDDEQNCKDCEFECDGRCLEATQLCNGIRDCMDGSDENSCERCAKEEDFRCYNGECVDKNSRCNGVTECLDGSDEENCITREHRVFCNDDQFQCSDGTCINDGFVCDGHSDCLDNSDEEHCGCTDEQWQCANGECIHLSGYCNGYADCLDSTDESIINCQYEATTTRYYETTHAPSVPSRLPQSTVRPFYDTTPRISKGVDGCNKNEWRCENGPCINQELRCNGYIDCTYDSSDELDCPPNSPAALRLKTYPNEQTVRDGGDVVLQCRDEGPYRANVKWTRKDNKPIKPGSVQRRGRLEMFNISKLDEGVYLCRAVDYLSHNGSELTARIIIEDRNIIRQRTPFIHCGPQESTCSNGQCIPKSGICNGKFDCSDRSDEELCNNVGYCEPNQFVCNNNYCVLKTWVCDNEDDCGDGSDERNCGTKKLSDHCHPVEFKCNNSQCIPRSYHCDGSVDCIDGSDEIGCAAVRIVMSPTPREVALNPGQLLELACQAVGIPTPIISWRRNWGHIPDKCISTSANGYGVLRCEDMQINESGAYSCEAMNNKGSQFGQPDAFVKVVEGNIKSPSHFPCSDGLFNRDARSESDCVRCFCFGVSNKCHSADLYKFTMPEPLGGGGTRLVGVAQSLYGEITIDDKEIHKQYYYQHRLNGAEITRVDAGKLREFVPFVTLPEAYNGNQLTSYGGVIRFKVQPHDYRTNFYDDNVSDIIIKGGNGINLFYNLPKVHIRSSFVVEAQLVEHKWLKGHSKGIISASREDIMMVLENVSAILLKAKVNDAGSNITEFTMESARELSAGLAHANLVEQCECPQGYLGLSCEKCASGYKRIEGGPWLGQCVKKILTCPPGQYGDPHIGMGCYDCPCPLTNKQNQFARTCHMGAYGRVVCDCEIGYDGETCEYCAEGYIGNPTIPGDQCRPERHYMCNPVGSDVILSENECRCKENVKGLFCDECAVGSFYLSNDFKQGCAQCFCTGVVSKCTSSNLRRKTLHVGSKFTTSVNDVKVYKSSPHDLNGLEKYNAATETDITPALLKNTLSLFFNVSDPAIFYWSLPAQFSGDKVTSYGGYLRFNLRVGSSRNAARNLAPDVQLISKNQLIFLYIGNLKPDFHGFINGSVQLLEHYWQRPDGKPVTREHLLLALADVKTILIKAKYTAATEYVSLEEASIDIAEHGGSGPLALHVEQCSCPEGYLGTSCEDCAPGYTRSNTGLYLKTCIPCYCNGHSDFCDPESGKCYDCRDNTIGNRCEECRPGFEKDVYDICVEIKGFTEHPGSNSCRCNTKGVHPKYKTLCSNDQCICKENVHGQHCDTCRPGYFELSQENPSGCLKCYCSGITTLCREAVTYSRIAIPAPVIGEDYGGYKLMNIYGHLVLSDSFVPATNESELMYILKSSIDDTLYWSLPVLPGNRVLSYGGILSVTQRFDELFKGTFYYNPGYDIIFVGNSITIYRTLDHIHFRANVTQSYKVLLTENGWIEKNSEEAISRETFMQVLSKLERIMVKATASGSLYSTAIADVSMDTAANKYNSGIPANGVEVCNCPPEYYGSSCESCSALSYRTHNGSCKLCSCNGHSCSLGSRGEVVCNCVAPFTGPTCSDIGTGQTTVGPLPLHTTSPSSTITVQITSPTIKIQEIGSSVNFTCQAYSVASRSPIKVYWGKMDGMLPTGRSQNIDGTLTLHQLTVSDSGIYVCEANDGINSATASVTLKVPGNYMTVPEVEIKPAFNEYMVGDEVTLECVATGNPLPETRWQRVSNRAFPVGAIISHSHIIIHRAKEADSGEYRCIATNTAGTTNRIALIAIRPIPGHPNIPELHVSPKNVTIDEGETIRITCTGNELIPSGLIKWRRYDKADFEYNVQAFGSILQISNAIAENQGVYLCDTEMPQVAPVSVYVVVNSKNHILTPQEVSVDREFYSIPEGESLNVECHPQGNPLPMVRWIRDNGVLDNNMNQRENTLTILNAKREDAGNYACEGVVRSEVVHRVYIQVDIESREKPRVEIYPAGENIVQIGTTYRLMCRATGMPKPTVTWSRSDGTSLVDSTNLIGEDVLSFQNVSIGDQGIYYCQAVNDAGTATASATILVKEEPSIKIIPDQQIFNIRKDDYIDIECRGQGHPLPYMRMTKNGNEVVRPHLGSVILRITQAREEDGGMYKCTAQAVEEEAISTEFYIEIIRGDGGNEEGSGENIIEIEKENPAQDIVVAEGHNLALKCETTDPMLEVKWSRAERRGLQDNAVVINNELIVYNVSKVDAGEYECFLVSRETGEPIKTEYRYVKVYQEPRITLYPPTQTVQPGQSPTVECIVHGDDIEEIVWKPSHEFSERVQIRKSTLIFHRIQVDDAGLYQCFTRNRVANASATAEVIVNEKTNRLPSVSHDNEQHGHVGDEVHLSCQVTSANHKIHWTKDNRALPRSVEQRRDGSLFIRKAQESDTGHYVCHIRDEFGRQTKNYINLQIDGPNCNFRCYDGSRCIDEMFLCDGHSNCEDNSDEAGCYLRDPDYFGGEDDIIHIERPKDKYAVGDNITISCRIPPGATQYRWLRMGTAQYLDTRNEGKRLILSLANAGENDSGSYRCTAYNIYGREIYNDVYIRILKDVEPLGMNNMTVYTAHLRDNVVLPCKHNLPGPVIYDWTLEYKKIPENVITNNMSRLQLRNVTGDSVGVYVCRVRNYQTSVEAKALLRVTGMIPMFNGDAYIVLPTIRDSYKRFNIEISFKPESKDGLILFNSEEDDSEGDYIALFLSDGFLNFIIQVDRENGPINVTSARPLTLSKWHRIVLKRTNSKLILEIDGKPIIKGAPGQYVPLDLHKPLYIGGVPNDVSLPIPLLYYRGFVGCISKLHLGNVPKNMMIESIEKYNVDECDTCNPNFCLNNGICQEANNDHGYLCYCDVGFAGANCEHHGINSCRPGLCSQGTCQNTPDGYQCKCPITATGKRCEIPQFIEYPAFTGSAYLAISSPTTSKLFLMSFKIKANSPVKDGVIMYCAASSQGLDGYTSLTVHDRHVEFQYDMADGNGPLILQSEISIPPNEWIEVFIKRISNKVAMRVNGTDYQEQDIRSTKRDLMFDTLLFVGGYDDSITLNENVGVSGGFSGCIKDISVSNTKIDITNSTLHSVNVQECSKQERGDVPEVNDNIDCSKCRNGGYCRTDNPYACTCMRGFTGIYCEIPYNQYNYNKPDPSICDKFPCENGGQCKVIGRGNSYSCDCPLGFYGINCETVVQIDEKVRFEGNGYVELPQSLIDYRRRRISVAMAIMPEGDGVLFFQTEMDESGDFILLQITKGFLSVQWDFGSGMSEMTLEDVRLVQDTSYVIILEIEPNNSIRISVDGRRKEQLYEGMSRILNVNSSIFLGGIPRTYNSHNFIGFKGCIHHVEFMEMGRALDIGSTAISAVNVQNCSI